MERIVNKYRKKAEVIMRKVKLTKESTKDILETLLKRSPNNYGKYEDAVADILAKVRQREMKRCLLLPENLIKLK